MNAKEAALSASRLREALQYDPATGIFVWRIALPGIGAGKPAGDRNEKGYWRIRLDGRLHKAHRLAWLYVHGVWPTLQIDHINGVRDDNRIANLREATGSQNLANSRRPKNNKSGFKGVCWDARAGSWKAYIDIQGKRKYLGRHDTAESAHAAYVRAATQAFGAFARTA